MILASSESRASRNSFSRCSLVMVTDRERLMLVCADSRGLRGLASSSAWLSRSAGRSVQEGAGGLQGPCGCHRGAHQGLCWHGMGLGARLGP